MKHGIREAVEVQHSTLSASTSTPSTQPAPTYDTEPLPAIAAAALERLARAFAPKAVA